MGGTRNNRANYTSDSIKRGPRQKVVFFYRCNALPGSSRIYEVLTSLLQPLKGLPTDHSELLTATEDSTSPANSNKQTKIHGRHRVINVWKCFKKPPLLKRTVFGSHSFKQAEVSTVRHILQSPTAIQTHLPHRHNSLLHRTDLYNSSHVHGTVVEMDRVSFRRSVSFMKRIGWLLDAYLFYCTAIELIGSDSQTTAVKMTTNLNIICTGTLRHNAGISYWPSTYKMSVKV